MKIRLGPSLTGRHEREGMGDTAQNVERIIATLFPMLRITISVPIVEQSVMWRGLTVIKAHRACEKDGDTNTVVFAESANKAKTFYIRECVRLIGVIRIQGLH